MTQTCVAPHDKDDPPLAAAGLLLCPAHYGSVRRALHQLPTLYAELGRCLATAGATGDRVSGSHADPSPVRLAVVDLRDQITHDLLHWHKHVATQCALTLIDGPTPYTTADWLLRHLDWLAKSAADAPVLPEVLRELTVRARTLISPPTNRHISLGPCPEDDCPGTLTATIRTGNRESSVTCSTCDLSKPPEDWLLYLGARYAHAEPDPAPFMVATNRWTRVPGTDMDVCHQAGRTLPVTLTEDTDPDGQRYVVLRMFSNSRGQVRVPHAYDVGGLTIDYSEPQAQAIGISGLSGPAYARPREDDAPADHPAVVFLRETLGIDLYPWQQQLLLTYLARKDHSS